jgi:putative ABC transport system permease protein
MDRFAADIRFAIRSLLRSPLVATAAVLSLGLGIGANASLFSAIDVFMIRPLDFDEADNLVAVWSTDTERGWTSASSSAPDYLDWRDRSRSLDLATWRYAGVNMSGTERPERLQAIEVTPNFFDVLRKRPVHGRGFTADEERAGGPGVAILGDAIWQRAFGGDPAVIGRILNLDGQPSEIVGIMPPRVRFERDPDIWLPMRFSGEELRNSRSLAVLGRIRDGYDIEAARADLSAVQSSLAREYPATNANVGVTMTTLQEEWFDEGFRQGSLISGTAVLFVLLIACANVANLLLARAAGREREIALRGALGARRGTIARQLFTESLLLALVGGALGVALAVIGVRGVRGLFPPGFVGVDGIVLSGRVMAYAAAMTLASGFIFGLAPALRSARIDLRSLLTDGGRGNTPTRGGRMRTVLVVAEISLAMVLLVSSALLVQAFVQIRSNEPGFRIDDVVTMALTLPESRYADSERVNTFTNDLLDRVAALPGIDAAGAADALPMRGGSGRYYTIPTEPPPDPGREPVVDVRSITPGFLDALGIEVVAGRDFTSADSRDAPPIVLISQRMAELHWPDRDPLGERITFAGVDHEIVGLVEDTRDDGLEEDPVRIVYFAAQQRTPRTLNLAVHTSLPVDRVAESIREVVRGIDPEQPLYAVSTMATITADEMAGNLAMAKVLGALAIIAFVLAAVGVYGVMAYSVSQRTMEMGIRMALGAQRAAVRNLVIRKGALITGLGIGIGLAVALSVTRLLSFFLYGVSPFSPLPFISVTVAIALTGLVASLVPAIRATRVDPIVSLKAD